MRDKMHIRGEIVWVTRNSRTGETRTSRTRNIVTNAGDLYYAQRAANTLPTNFTTGAGVFDGIVELYNGASAAPAKDNDRSDLVGLVATSAKAMDSGYPKINDDDTENPGRGADILTYRVSYTISEAVATGIADIIITNPSPGASEALLMHGEQTARDKANDETLKVFVNHELVGE